MVNIDMGSEPVIERGDGNILIHIEIVCTISVQK